MNNSKNITFSSGKCLFKKDKLNFIKLNIFQYSFFHCSGKFSLKIEFRLLVYLTVSSLIILFTLIDKLSIFECEIYHLFFISIIIIPFKYIFKTFEFISFINHNHFYEKEHNKNFNLKNLS